MNTSLDVLTIIAAIVAVVILFRLRNVLGRKTGDESSRAERYARESRSPVGAPDNVIAMPRPASGDTTASDVDQDGSEEAAPRRKNEYSGPAAETIAAIKRVDSDFDVAHFLAGARAAYEMIVSAFAEGNRKLLKQLLSKEVYDGFNAAITDRESRGESIEMHFVGIDSADVLDAELRNRIARITVKFVSQLTQAVKDSGGAVIDGDAKTVRTVTDVWTFTRDVGTRDPNWRLSATQSAN